MQGANRKVLVLFQRTRFCEFASGTVREKFGDMVLCEGLGTYEEGRARMRGCPEGAPVMLIWGDGAFHHLSNVLNMPFSVKYVFDNHTDDAFGTIVPAYHSHNVFSRHDGVIVRVCVRLGPRPEFPIYDEAEGNGALHISMDLDFLKGFPALPWMSVGGNETGALHDYAGSLTGRYSLTRFDIGGYHEMGHPSDAEMAAVYASYYERPIRALLPALMRQASLD